MWMGCCRPKHRGKPQSLRELGKGRPHEKGAVLGRKLGHRQRTQFINAHGGVMIFRRALHFFCRVAPRGIGVNDGVFFDIITLLWT